MANVFISYHHANDQWAKDYLTTMNGRYSLFNDMSVNSGEIDDEFLTDEEIRVVVRDEYLRDSTVTIVLVGTETRLRKHVDWEVYSSMRDSRLNPKSGVILISLPSTGMTSFSVGHGDLEKKAIYPEWSNWVTWDRSEHERHFPYLSTRMLDNIVTPNARISVVPWERIANDPDRVRTLVQLAHDDRQNCEYDFSTPMRRRNG